MSSPSAKSPYDTALDANSANYAPLTPMSLIARAAAVYPDHASLIHGEHTWTWAQTYQRSRKLASALQRRGIGKNDTVAVLAPNTPPTKTSQLMPWCHLGQIPTRPNEPSTNWHPASPSC